jgi:GntR family transcriptional regulator/MocR family aminotransferase
MAKQATGAILPNLELSTNGSPLPLYQQIYDRIREAILGGVLTPGTKLPSTRTLASDLNISRNTVEVAFMQLEAEGFLIRQVGAGTYVSLTIPEYVKPPKAASRDLKANESSDRKQSLSTRGNLIFASGLEADPSSGRNFAPCVPGLDSFPFKTWHRLVARRSRYGRDELLQYGTPAGHKRLREVVASYLATARGVKCDWQQVIILASTQQALDLVSRLLLDEGEKIWFEEPGYLSARATFLSLGAKIEPVAVDDDGLDVEAGKSTSPDARLVYITPSHQYPTGVTMSLARRLDLLNWAAESSAWIIEDDYDSEFRYTGRPLAAVQGLDTAGRVIYTGTFNKVLFPSLRLAYVVVPKDLIDAFVAARSMLDGHPPTFMQSVLADFIAEGHFSAHLRRMRMLYQERREVLLEAIEKRLSPFIRAGVSNTGLHVVGWLPARADDRALSNRAAAIGLDIPPLSRYYFGSRSKPGILLNYAAMPPKNIRQGINALASIL